MRDFFLRVFDAIKAFFQRIFHIRTQQQAVEIPEENNSVDFPVVCYYGCPNSNKAKKLQLSKKLYR
ncbi:MAG: hypothetical protein IJT27_07455 [Clostridia bacterium]|nr:hypothetical protein [Clostridia bacterium]